jgi:hypothetical protein
MIYTWLVTVERMPTDAFVYSIGKVQHTRVELLHLGFTIVSVEDFYTFLAQHHKQSMITLAALRLDYIKYYATTV